MKKSGKSKSKKKDIVSRVWMIRWGFHGPEPELKLKESGIKEMVIDLVTIRKDFDKEIRPYVETLYKVFRLSLSEKLSLSKYNYRENWDWMFGGAVPMFTHYQSGLYRELMEKTARDEDCTDLIEQWKKYPKGCIVGHNPYIEAIEVFNVRSIGEGFDKDIEWDEPRSDGSRVRKRVKEGDLKIVDA